MRRVALGIVGLALVLGGLALPFASGASWTSYAGAVMLKSGVVTLLFWLAYHQLVRMFEVVPPWLIGAALLGVGTIIVIPRPQTIMVVLGLFAIIIVLHISGIFLAPFATKGATAKKPTTGARKKSGAKKHASLKSEFPELKSKSSNQKS